jgi:hypothetical protein
MHACTGKQTSTDLPPLLLLLMIKYRCWVALLVAPTSRKSSPTSATTHPVTNKPLFLLLLLQVLGGLVGGPDQQDKFPDIRNDYQRSEVAMDFNAGFTGAAAGLAAFDAKRKTRTCSNHGTGEGGRGRLRAARLTGG